MSDDQINQFKQQNPDEYEKFIKKIKKKNFIYKGTSAERRNLFENLKEDTTMFDVINPSEVRNKAASYKRRKLTSVADGEQDTKGIG